MVLPCQICIQENFDSTCRNLYWVKITSGIDLSSLLLFIYISVCVPFSIFQHVPGCSTMCSINAQSSTAFITTLQWRRRQSLPNLSSLQILTRRLFVNSKSYKNTNEVLQLSMAYWITFFGRDKKKQLNLSATFTSAVLFFLIHTCTPCRSVSAAAPQLSCLCNFHPNSSPVFVVHHVRCTGLELWITPHLLIYCLWNS